MALKFTIGESNYLTELTIASKACGLFMARSARTLRFRPMFCFASLPINVLTGGGVDPLDPEGAEVALLGLAVTVGVSQTFLVSVLSYGPDIPSGEEITAGSLENLLAASPRGY